VPSIAHQLYQGGALSSTSRYVVDRLRQEGTATTCQIYGVGAGSFSLRKIAELEGLRVRRLLLTRRTANRRGLGAVIKPAHPGVAPDIDLAGPVPANLGNGVCCFGKRWRTGPRGLMGTKPHPCPPRGQMAGPGRPARRSGAVLGIHGTGDTEGPR